MKLSFENKVAFVTGGAGGIGFATAKAFAEAGAAVVLADIDDASLRVETEKLQAAGHQALAVHCDVANEESVAAMVKLTISTFGRLDAAFNNAGIHVDVAETADVDSDDLERLRADGLVSVENDTEEDKTRITLSDPSQSEAALADFPEALKEDVTAILDAYGDLDHNALLKTVYEKYPAYAKKSRVHKKDKAAPKKGSPGRRAKI